MGRIDAATQLCAVIGNPIEHSLSPAMHNAAFEASGLNYVYLAFRVEDVAGCLAGMRALPSFRGLSVTIPHKMSVLPYLDEIEPMARHVGSVNTIAKENGKLIGSTTDGPGALRALTQAEVSLERQKVAFIGSGGAVRAVAFALAELTGVAQITILGRTASRVAALVKDLHDKTPVSVCGSDLYDDLEQILATHTVVIQGTPIGMYPRDNENCIPAELLRPEHVVFDMVYRPYKTRLLQAAEDQGCRIIPGIEMLVNQAALQFERWTGIPAPYGVMRAVALSELCAQAEGK